LPTFRPRVQFPSPAPILDDHPFLGHTTGHRCKQFFWHLNIS